MRRKDREVKNRNEIEDIFSKCKTCHVAMIDGDMPYVVPLSFGYRFTDGDVLELYFHSAFEGRKLNILKRNNKVCFEISSEGENVVNIEAPCDSGYFYSCVIGNGKVEFIEDIAEKCDALSVLFTHQSGQDVVFDRSQAESVCVYKIVSSDFTGKRKPTP